MSFLCRAARPSVLAILAGAASLTAAPGAGNVSAVDPAHPEIDAPATAAAHSLDVGPAVRALDRTLAEMAAERAARPAIDVRVAALRPGDYLWLPERQAEGTISMIVSIAEQKAYVYRAGKLIAVSTVSTGRRGHATPTGSFTILQKKRRHFSNLYNNAPMPNMQRLTWDGIALHAGALPGYPASHGCVRLPLEFSRLLFGVTAMGGSVRIVAGAANAPDGALPPPMH